MRSALKNRFQSVFNPEGFSFKNTYTRCVVSKIYTCHTAVRGYHCFQCNNRDCSDIRLQYHSCGNRHCSFCGTLKKDAWEESRIDDLLPCPYYHMVFTVPHAWNKVMMQAPAMFYKILFDAASECLLTLGQNARFLGATPGITSVLHTWGQKLDYHVHLHCIVSGGGIKNKSWIPPKRQNGKFLFPPAIMKKMYKAIFLRLIRERRAEIPVAENQIDQAIDACGKKKWKVYAKAPFGGPQQVVRYLGRYTHRTAITYHRIRSVEDNTLCFEYKDYRDNQNKFMSLDKQEFLRRFEYHILPARFVRIRHYGFLSNRGKVKRLLVLRASMGLKPNPPKIDLPVAVRMLEKYGRDITKCPHCKKGRYELLMTKRYGKVIYSKPRDVPLN